MLVAGCVLIFINWQKEQKRQDFLSKLQGEIVFTRRNSDGVSDIWKINANGTDEVMLFHNDLNNFLTDSRQPQWSNNNKKIYFTSFDKEKKKIIYEMNADGDSLKIIENPKGYTLTDTTILSRADDIIVENGDVFYFTNYYVTGTVSKKIKVYNYKFKCDSKFCPGASEASWSPDKKYIIFNGDGGIFIADLNSNAYKLTNGSDPDWK